MVLPRLYTGAYGQGKSNLGVKFLGLLKLFHSVSFHATSVLDLFRS